MRARILLFGAFGVFAAAIGSAVVHAQNATVWTGVYTTAQAARGEKQFMDHCAECHNSALTGGEGPALIGNRFWTSWQERPVQALFDRISKNMPFDDLGVLAGSLPRQTYVDLVAFILSRNGFPAGTAELSDSAGMSAEIVQQGGPTELAAGTLATVVGCLAKEGSTFVVTKATRPSRASVKAADARQATLGDRQIPLKFLLTPLDRYVGQRVVASGTLIGAGGADGMNTDSVTSVSPTCE